MDGLRLPFFVGAIVCCVLALAAEIGAGWFPALRQLVGLGRDAPGLGIPSLALLDGLLVFTVALMALPLLLPERLHGRVQGCATFIVSLLALIGAFVLAFVDLGLLALMVSLLLAAPFGTLAYLALFGAFPTGAAAALIATLIALRLIASLLLVLAHQRFLQNNGLVLLVLTTLVAYLVIAFLQALVPMPLVSILDAVGGIVGCILALIWGIVLLIASLPAIVKAIV